MQNSDQHTRRHAGPRTGATLAALAALAGCGDPAAVGEQITPSIEIVDLAGLRGALERHRGRAVLLNFWAIWCAPCVAELPELVRVHDEFADRGGGVIGVSYDLMVPGPTHESIAAKMDGFARARGIDFPILIYDADDYDAINEHFALPGQVPVTLAIDRAGNVVDRVEGQAGIERFRALMELALR